MAVVALGAIFGGIAGLFTWMGNLPSWAKYVIFLAGLGIDAGIIAGYTGGTGAFGTIINLAAQAVGIKGFYVTSPELLLFALFVPLMYLFFKMYH